MPSEATEKDRIQALEQGMKALSVALESLTACLVEDAEDDLDDAVPTCTYDPKTVQAANYCLCEAFSGKEADPLVLQLAMLVAAGIAPVTAVNR